MRPEGESGRAGEGEGPSGPAPTQSRQSGRDFSLAPSFLLEKYGLWLVGLGFVLLVLLGIMVDADLRLAQCFYDTGEPQRWFLKTAAPWIWLNQYGEYPVWLLAAGAAAVWCGSLYRRAWVRHRRACALLLLAAALGPGLLVNGILKPLWGRPRPHQVESFGGARPYRDWWQPGNLGGGRSFSSGHAASGYVLVVGAYVVAQRRRRLVLGGALLYGSLVGLARIVTGAHFVSDVLWSGSLMCFTVATLQAVLPAMLPSDSTPGFAPAEGNLYNRATLGPS
jgi:lipid A 4'-phosphatase